MKGCAVCLGVALLACTWRASAAEAPREVLLLLPENAHVPFLATFVQSLSERLQQATPRIEVRVEVLPDDLLDEPAAQWFDPRVAGRAFSAVVALGTPAFQFALAGRERLWPRVPIVFDALAREEAREASRHALVTGTYFSESVGSTLALGFALFPATDHVAVIGSMASHGSGRGDLAPMLAPWTRRVRLIDLTGLTLEELRQRVAGLPPRSLVLLLGPAVDRNGRWLLPRHLLAELTGLTPAPFVGDAPAGIGHGFAGGAVIDAQANGQAIADQVMQALFGPTGTRVAASRREPLRLQVDWRQLAARQVALSRVPPSAEILYRPPSLWEAYRWQVIGAAFALLLQSAWVVVLVVERRQRRRAELAARQRLAELAHLNRLHTVSALSLTLAHELNQPLGTVLSTAQTGEVLLERPQPPLDELRLALGRIVQATERAAAVVRSLRQLAHKAVPAPGRVRIDDAVAQTAALLAAEAQLRQVTWVLDLHAATARARIDQAQLQQVLINLLLNAMEAMQAVAVAERRLTLSSHVANGQVCVRVEDGGPGLPVDQPERVFAAFYTTREGGLGLGLGIARDLAAAHGGSLHAANRPGGGARFTLCLPCDDAAGAAGAQALA